MEELWQAHPEITTLYSTLRLNPDYLKAFDEKQFADTPLHIAAGAGRTRLALEIQMLMPSFGRKLNPDGLSPLQLALQGRHVDTVRAMIKVERQLVGLRGREGITPLHYCAAEGNDVDILSEFLLCYPDAIEELTTREDSAVHVAVRNGNLEAFEVLLGWLKRTHREEVLEWRNCMGDTVLHLAARALQLNTGDPHRTNDQLEVMKLLVGNVDVNDKNSAGHTALDIVMELPNDVKNKAEEILHGRRRRWWQRMFNPKPKSGSFVHHPHFASFADYFRSHRTKSEMLVNRVARTGLILSSETRNAILVVAALIATATFQVAVSPPGAFSKYIPETSAAPSYENETESKHRDDVRFFVISNSIAFGSSSGLLLLALPFHLLSLLLWLSLYFFVACYVVVMEFTLPSAAVLMFVIFLVFMSIYFVKWFGSGWLKKWRWLKKWGLLKKWGWLCVSRRFLGSNHFFERSVQFGWGRKEVQP